MSVLQNDQFIVAPEWPAPPAQVPAPAVVDLGPVLRRFEGWPGLTPHQRAKLIRDSGVAVARSAGLSHRQIAPAAGVTPGHVGTILGGFGG